MKIPNYVLLPFTAAIFFAAATSSRAVTVLAALSSQDSIVGQRQASGPALGYDTDLTGPLTTGVSGATGSRGGFNTVIGFTLPTLAVGETIDAATFSITISSTNNGAGTVNVSLFGLATTNPDGTGTSLYSTNGTGAIDSTFTNTNAAAGVIPSADVSNFILSLYTGNMPSQTEAFFRLNLNSDPFPSINRATFTNGTAQLSLNVVSTAPEPSRAVLLLFGAAGLFLRRRRK